MLQITSYYRSISVVGVAPNTGHTIYRHRLIETKRLAQLQICGSTVTMMMNTHLHTIRNML